MIIYSNMNFLINQNLNCQQLNIQNLKTSPMQNSQPEIISKPQVQGDQQMTEQTLAQFNKICQSASQLMNSYKQQSIALKEQISGMVNVYQKSTQGNKDAIPVDKIISITQQYQIGMRQANQEYGNLADQLKRQEIQRDQMVNQIQDMFQKLEKMEVKMKNKKAQKNQLHNNHQSNTKNQSDLTQLQNKIQSLNITGQNKQ